MATQLAEAVVGVGGDVSAWIGDLGNPVGKVILEVGVAGCSVSNPCRPAQAVVPVGRCPAERVGGGLDIAAGIVGIGYPLAIVAAVLPYPTQLIKVGVGDESRRVDGHLLGRRRFSSRPAARLDRAGRHLQLQLRPVDRVLEHVTHRVVV